jgi:predicted ribonuclease YlaK
MDNKKVLIDTNCLIDTPEIITKYNVVLLSYVLKEVDKHKMSHNSELAYKARKATRFIEQNLDKITFDFKVYKCDHPDLDDGYVDDKIITACLENGYKLATRDLLLKHKSIGFGIEIVDVSSTNSQIDDIYSGYKIVYMTKEEAKDVYNHLDENKWGLLVNQYLIIYDTYLEGTPEKELEYEGHLGTMKWDGHSLVDIKLPSKQKVKAKNPIQECAIDLLWNKKVPIRIIAGTFGSGKTYLSVKAGIDFIKNRSDGHSKLMVVRNPIGTGEEIGFLKGTKEDKTGDFFKPIIQHLEGGEFEASLLEQNGQLVKEIPYYMKGLSIDETFILVDEAEDLNKKIIKLLGTRLGTNSSITFSGDIEQAEDKYVGNNGLTVAIEKLKGHPLVGIVVMKDDVRSEASKVFADL